MRRGAATADEVDASTPTPPPAQRTGMRPWDRLRDRVTATDPLILVVGLVSLVVYVLHGFDKALGRDLGLYMYGGQRLLEGDPPYVGVLNRAGPLAHALPAVGIGAGRLLGVGDIHGARVFFMLLAVACVCLVYVVVRDLTRSRSAAVIAATAFLGFEGFLDLATNGPREKTAMVLFLLAALLAVVHRRWATAGVMIALGTLTWQPVFFVAVVVAVVAALLAPNGRLRALLRILVAGAATSALVLFYYAVNGALHTFFEGFVLINAQYTRQPSPWKHPGRAWTDLQDGFGPSLWVIVLGLVAIPVIAIVSSRRAWRTRDVAATTWVALGVGWLAGVLWSSTAFNYWPDIFVLLPLAAIGVGGAAAFALRRLNLKATLAVTTALAVIGVAYATDFSVTTRSHEIERQRTAIARVLRVGPHPWTALSVQAPEVLVMTHHQNLSPYQMFDFGFTHYLDDTYPGGIAGYVAWIQKTQPTYIVMQRNIQPPWLMPWLTEHYDKVGGARQFNFWVNTATVSEQERLAMKRASKAAKEARS